MYGVRDVATCKFLHTGFYCISPLERVLDVWRDVTMQREFRTQ